MSVVKSGSQQSNIKVTQCQQGAQNNININVNNLIINNTNNPNMGLYPNNYGVYLANSSFFTKLGNDIMNSKAGNSIPNASKTINKRYMSQPKSNLKLKNQNNSDGNIEVTKVTVNNIYSNNFAPDLIQGNAENFNEAPGVLENSGDAGEELDSFKDDLENASYKSSSVIIKNSLINNMINNILDQNKNNINSTPTKFHIKKNVSYKQFTDNNLRDTKIKQNEESKTSEFHHKKESLEIPKNHSLDFRRSESIGKQASDVFLIVNDEILKEHGAIWDLMIELEGSNESKHYLSTVTNKLLKMINDQIVQNELNFEIFSNSVLNKVYIKILKIYIIMLIYLKHISLDYNYENNMKNNVKKLIGSVNEHLLNLIENYVFNKESNNETKFSSEFIEKYFKLSKLHKIKRNNKDSAINNMVNLTIYKNLEVALNSVKSFSNNFFKIGYFKPLHTICLEIFRNIDNYSLNTVICLVTKHILYYIIHAEAQIREKLANLSANKSTNLNSVILSMNTMTNVTPPFIPSAEEDVYTLVLDLDETLVHFFYTPSGGTFLVRPGAHEFLQEMSQHYEIVIFTAAMKDYADNILDKLDPNKNLIKHRLYRHHTTITNMGVIKDLSKLGRNLSKIIIIDNIAENFKMQPNNGLFIKTWNDDMKDNQLYDFAKLLRDIKVLNVPDVRNVLRKIKDEVFRKLKKNCSNPYANIEISKLIQ